jgi:hypothetical protein
VTQIRLIEATDPEWDRWIESTTHDVYHTAGYHRVANFIGEGTPLLLVVGDRDRFVAWPYLLQGIPDSAALVGGPAHDVTSTYGYSGPLVRGYEPGDPFISSAWDAIREAWRAQHAVTAFTRFHPILENHRWFTELAFDAVPAETQGTVVTGETVSIDATAPEAEVLAAYPRNFRQEIAQSRRRGFVTTLDEEWTHLDRFVELYTETMERNRARSDYFLKRDYFDKLIDELGRDVMLFIGTLGSDVVAANLFMSHHGILHPHLAGTSTEHLSLSPLKVMWDDVRRWAADRGDRIIHLGGGRGGSNDSLYDFKARFSPRRHAFYTGRWILDRRRHDILVESALGETGSASGYFPRYRAPRPID